MSTLIDNLLNGPCYLLCANGQYLGASVTETDSSGNPVAVTVPARAAAALVSFTQVTAVSNTRVVVTVQQAGSGSYLSVNGESQVVFASSSASGQFTAVQGGPGVFSLGQDVSGNSGSFAVLDAASNTFSLVSGAPGGSAELGLAPQLPVDATLWSYGTGQPLVGTPYVYQGAVFIGDGQTLMNCLDMLTGQVVWEYGHGTAAQCAPEVDYANGLVFTCDATGLVHAVYLNTGVQAWTFQSSAPVYAAPGAYLGTLFVPSSDGILYALSSKKKGEELWRYPSTGNVGGISFSPVLVGTTVFFATGDSRVLALNWSTGELVWAYDVGLGTQVSSDLAADTENLYFGTDSGQLVALSQSTGDWQWYVQTEATVTARPAVYDTAVYFGDSGGNCYAVTIASGVWLWTSTTGGVISGTEAVNGVVYFTTTGGTLYTLEPSTGEILSSYVAASELSGAPVPYSGALYLNAVDTVMSVRDLRSGFNPLDAVALLFLSEYANLARGEESHPTSMLPAGCTQLGEFRSTQEDEFAAGAVLQLNLPGTDQAVVVVAMGVQPDAFFICFETSVAPLADVPATILGSEPADGAQVNQSLLDSYQDVRPGLVAALQGTGGSTVVVTGFGGGGALAALAALDLVVPKAGMPQPSAVSLVTFGAPAPGNQVFAGMLEERCSLVRVVALGDPFPYVLTPAQGYAQVGATPITLGSPAVTAAATGGAPSTTLYYQTCLTGRS